MSAFKDAVRKDVQATFLNLDEFADYHEINGERIPCVLDKDVTGEAPKAKGNVTMEGVFVNSVTIYVAENALKTRPVEGERLDVDGSLHIVSSVSDEAGMWVIVAEEFGQ